MVASQIIGPDGRMVSGAGLSLDCRWLPAGILGVAIFIQGQSKLLPDTFVGLLKAMQDIV
jgi:hypothetical protein